MSECITICEAITSASTWLYRWQTLVAGGLALIGAYLTVRKIREQLAQSERHRNDDSQRRLNAARLTLPLALAEISELIQCTADEIASELEQLGAEGFDSAFDANVEGKAFRKHFEPVQLSDNVLEAFREFVQSLNDNQDIRHVAELIASIQIYLSRYNSFDFGMAGVQTTLEGYLLDAGKIKMMIDGMFNYARFVDDSSFGVVDVISLNDAWDQIHGKAQGLVFRRSSPDFFFPGIQERVQRYKELGLSPWTEKFEG